MTQHKCNCITDQKKLVALQDTNDVRLPQQTLKFYIESHDLLLGILCAASEDERKELIRQAGLKITQRRTA